MVVWDPEIGAYTLERAFDIDECTHANVTDETNIFYPQYLCMNDPTGWNTFYEGVYFLC